MKPEEVRQLYAAVQNLSFRAFRSGVKHGMYAGSDNDKDQKTITRCRIQHDNALDRVHALLGQLPVIIPQEMNDVSR